MGQQQIQISELYVAYRDYLNYYMLKLARDREEAADLVQETFLRLCQQGSLPEHPRAWLSQTGYRLFVDGWRKTKRFTCLPFDDIKAIPHYDTPEQAALDSELEQSVEQSLLRMNPKTQTIFQWRMKEGCSYREIADRLRCSENTVKTCMRRGRHQLTKGLRNAKLLI